MRLYKQLFAAGILAYVGLFALALIFYKERIILPDDANYVFDLVTNHGRFAIFHQRFIAVLTQWLPYAAIRLDMPLDMVARLYSLNLVLFYLICYILCGLSFRNYQAAIALLLSGLLFTTFTFYWMVSELIQGIALFFLVFATLSQDERDRRPRPRWMQAIVATAIIITVAFAHSLMLFVVSYLLLYLWIARPQHRRRVIITAAIYISTLIIKALFFRDDYDSHALGGLKNFIGLFPDYRTGSMRRFLELCTGIYCWIPIVFLANAACYIRGRSWLKLGLMTIYCVCYLLLTTISFPDVDGHDFYQENLYMPVAVFLSVPFVYDVLPMLKPHYLAAGIVLLIVGSGLYRILDRHRLFSARLHWQRGLIRQYDGRKVILSDEAFPKDTLMMAWSSPYEFWLLSTIEQQKTASILITGEPEKYIGETGTRVFVPAFGVFPYEELPERYFMFRDTVNRYEWVR